MVFVDDSTRGLLAPVFLCTNVTPTITIRDSYESKNGAILKLSQMTQLATSTRLNSYLAQGSIIDFAFYVCVCVCVLILALLGKVFFILRIKIDEAVEVRKMLITVDVRRKRRYINIYNVIARLKLLHRKIYVKRV